MPLNNSQIYRQTESVNLVKPPIIIIEKTKNKLTFNQLIKVK